MPATRWSTFGRSDFMRVPLPAARMTTWTGGVAGTLMLGAMCLVLVPGAGARCCVLGAACTKHPARGTQHPHVAPSTWHPAPTLCCDYLLSTTSRPERASSLAPLRGRDFQCGAK